MLCDTQTPTKFRGRPSDWLFRQDGAKKLRLRASTCKLRTVSSSTWMIAHGTDTS